MKYRRPLKTKRKSFPSITSDHHHPHYVGRRRDSSRRSQSWGTRISWYRTIW